MNAVHSPTIDTDAGWVRVARNLPASPALKHAVTGVSKYQQFLNAIRVRLAHELPGRDAQMEMAPATRPDVHDTGTNGKNCSEAAVLALFYPDPLDSELARLLLTVRPEGMAKHAGQVALPGGRREAEETLEETAIRETEEEVHILRSRIQILGALTSLYIPPSGFCVFPYVGAVLESPDMEATSDEVAALFGVSVSELIDSSTRQVTQMNLRGSERDIPYFALNGKIVWGATAMMLAELSVILTDIQDWV